jgi:hypothetical protein
MTTGHREPKVAPCSSLGGAAAGRRGLCPYTDTVTGKVASQIAVPTKST